MYYGYVQTNTYCCYLYINKVQWIKYNLKIKARVFQKIVYCMHGFIIYKAHINNLENKIIYLLKNHAFLSSTLTLWTVVLISYPSRRGQNPATSTPTGLFALSKQS